MKELKIYLDKNRKEEVKKDIVFDPVVAGETSTKKIYLFNDTDYYMDVELKLEGKHVSISKEVRQIEGKKMEKVEFKFTPKTTLMKPITAKLKIKITYVVR